MSDPLNESGSSTDEEAGDQVSAKKTTEYFKKEQSREIGKLRRQALIKGMQAGTSGMAQDIVYTLLDMVSQALVMAQLYINIKSVWGGGGCNKGNAMSTEMLWFWVQLALNALVTIAQLGLWLWGFFVSGLFCLSYQKCPTSKDANTQHPMIAYRELQAKMDGVALDEMEDDERAEALSEYPTNEDLKYDEDFKEFKKELGTLGRIHSLQGSVTTMRAFIGALGAMIEPALAAATGLASMQVTSAAKLAEQASFNITLVAKRAETEAAKMAQEYAAKAAKAAAESDMIKRCLTNRQISATGSGIIAAIGVKQATMKAKYLKLLMLNQLREKDIDQYETSKANGATNAKRRVTDEAIEMELQDLLGATGKKYLSYISGQEAPAE